MFKNVKEFESFLETKEGKKYMKKFAEDLEKKVKLQKELVEKDVYIKWLEGFAKEHPNFSDDSWLYRPEEVSKEDYENVSKLSSFFCAIQRYAAENYIYSTPCEYGESYTIKYNSKLYEIGTIVGQGAFSFCNTIEINEKATIIPFEEISNPSEKTRTRTAIIEIELKRIDNLFRDLNQKGISSDTIIQRAEATLKKLKK